MCRGVMSMQLSKRQENVLLIIWTVALVAMLGSLYYSDYVGYLPCKLCWIQRIFMYPLVIIYGAALWKKNIDVAFSGLILSGIGMCIAVYHYGVQKIPVLDEAGGICGDVPCNLQYVNYFGFITIPFLSAIAFITIFILHIVISKSKR